MRPVVVLCTSFHGALTCHSGDLLSESEPEYQDMLDEGLARYFDVKCLGRIGQGFRVEERFLKKYVSWSAARFGWHGDPAKVGQLITLMEIVGRRPSAVLGTKATGYGRRDADQECDAVGSAGIPAHHVPQRAAVLLEDGDEHDSKILLRSRGDGFGRSGGTWRTSQCWSTFSERQKKVTECMAFGDSAWSGDRETCRSTAAELGKLGNHCIEGVSCFETVIALSSVEAEFHALQRTAVGALQIQHVSAGLGSETMMRRLELATLSWQRWSCKVVQASCTSRTQRLGDFESLGRDGNHSCYGVSWLVAGDVETQCKLQQRTLCGDADTWMLATCGPVEIMC